MAIRYYLLPSRLWELILGATACLLAFHIYKYKLFSDYRHDLSFVIIRILSVASIVAILASMVFVKETMVWPNELTLVPALATVVVLMAFHLFGPAILPNIANNKFLGIVGRSSYSLYLWHWPILGILIYSNSDYGTSLFDYVIYIVLVIIFTSMTYILVEKKRKRILKWQAHIILLVFVIFSIYASQERTFDDYPEKIQMILNTGKFADECRTCVDVPTEPFVILLGDSHAKMIIQTMEMATRNIGLQLVYIKRPFDSSDPRIMALAESPLFSGMLIAARWSMYAVGFPADEPEEKGNRYMPFKNGALPKTPEEATQSFRFHLEESMDRFQNMPILILLQVPRYSFFPKKEAIMDWAGLKLRSLPVKTIDKHYEEHRVVNAIFVEIAERYRTVHVIDPAKILCPDEKCVWRDEWNLLYKDDDHLSIYGAEKLKQQITTNLLLHFKRLQGTGENPRNIK